MNTPTAMREPTPADNTLLTCRHCHRQLPADHFERYATGTRRHCHYELHTRQALRRWRLREKARLFMGYCR